MTYDIRLDGSESTGPEGVYLVWSWSHGYPMVQYHASLEKALYACHYMRYDDAYVELIDGPAGIVPKAEIQAWQHALDERQEQEAEAREEHRNLLRHAVEVRHPDQDQSVVVEGFDDLSDAVQFLGGLNRPGRARIVLQSWNGLGWKRERVIVDWGQSAQEAAA